MTGIKTARERERVCLGFSSPYSDREQTTEDNKKQICGQEEGEGNKNDEKVGHSGVGQEKRGRRSGEKEKKKGGGEEKVTAKKGGLSSTLPQEIDPLMFPT